MPSEALPICSESAQIALILIRLNCSHVQKLVAFISPLFTCCLLWWEDVLRFPLTIQQLYQFGF